MTTRNDRPTLLDVVLSLSPLQRELLAYMQVHWEAGEATATLHFAAAGADWLADPDQHVPITTHRTMDRQLHALAASGVVGQIEASRLDYGAAGVRAGYWPVAWNIVCWREQPLPPGATRAEGGEGEQ